jgi:hypothetical protein
MKESEVGRKEKIVVVGLFIGLMSLLILYGQSFVDALIETLALLTAAYKAKPHIKIPYVKIPKMQLALTLRLTEKMIVVLLIVGNQRFEWRRPRYSFSWITRSDFSIFQIFMPSNLLF